MTMHASPQSVPGEVSLDQVSVLQRAEQHGGRVTEQELVEGLGWESRRARRALEQMVGQGLVWVDGQGQGQEYWVPSIFTSQRQL